MRISHFWMLRVCREISASIASQFWVFFLALLAKCNSIISRRVLSLLISMCAVAVIGLIGAEAGASDDQLRSILEARYGALKVAMAARDEVAIGAILSPDFASIDVSGQTTIKPQMIAEVISLKPDPNKVSTTTLGSISVEGDMVTVEQTYDMKTSKLEADRVAHTVELITRSTDTWNRVADTWLVQRTVTKELSYFVDGQLRVHKLKS